MMSHFVYILQSERNDSYYIGSSDNPQARLIGHNSGKSSYTRSNRPYRIVFTQEFASLSEARIIENKIKSWKRRDFIDKIIQDGYIKFAQVLGD